MLGKELMSSAVLKGLSMQWSHGCSGQFTDLVPEHAGHDSNLSVS